MNREFEWTEAAHATLRELWADGLSTAKIGERLGVSKSAVVGKSHRLKLPSRPSPIQRPEGWVRPPKKEPARREVRKPGPTTLPELSPDAPPPVPAQPGPTYRPPSLPAPNVSAARPCCWPIGEPGNRHDFRFCEAPSDPSRPYCREHCELAFVNYNPARRAA